MVIEYWKDIAGYEGLYRISSLGRIKRCQRKIWNGKTFALFKEKVLTPFIVNSGYYAIKLKLNGKYTHHYIHRLVASAFIQNPLGLPQVNHKNYNRLDNRVENLEWVTAKQNLEYSKVFSIGGKSLKGKPKSPEHRRKISEALRK